MVEFWLVVYCVKVMCDVMMLFVIVKYCIGIDKVDSYDFVQDFVVIVVEVGCEVFIVYVCNVWLQGLLFKENCEVLLLCYEVVVWFKVDFLVLIIVVNGGLKMLEQIVVQFEVVDGVMIGCEVYYEFWSMVQWDLCFFGSCDLVVSCEQVEVCWFDYFDCVQVSGCFWVYVMCYVFGLWNGMLGVWCWCQVWSDYCLKMFVLCEVVVQVIVVWLFGVVVV